MGWPDQHSHKAASGGEQSSQTWERPHEHNCAASAAARRVQSRSRAMAVPQAEAQRTSTAKRTTLTIAPLCKPPQLRAIAVESCRNLKSTTNDVLRRREKGGRAPQMERRGTHRQESAVGSPQTCSIHTGKKPAEQILVW